jgi:Na+/H+-dicarboxylate symporter
MLVNMVPTNPVQAAANMDMLAVIFFSIIFGAALTLIPRERAEPMTRLLDALVEIVIKIIDFAMRLAPYGVFGLIFVVTFRFGWSLLGQLGVYILVVVVGLLIHGSARRCSPRSRPARATPRCRPRSRWPSASWRWRPRSRASCCRSARRCA